MEKRNHSLEPQPTKSKPDRAARTDLLLNLDSLLQKDRTKQRQSSASAKTANQSQTHGSAVKQPKQPVVDANSDSRLRRAKKRNINFLQHFKTAEATSGHDGLQEDVHEGGLKTPASSSSQNSRSEYFGNGRVSQAQNSTGSASRYARILGENPFREQARQPVNWGPSAAAVFGSGTSVHGRPAGMMSGMVSPKQTRSACIPDRKSVGQRLIDQAEQDQEIRRALVQAYPTQETMMVRQGRPKAREHIGKNFNRVQVAAEQLAAEMDLARGKFLKKKETRDTQYLNNDTEQYLGQKEIKEGTFFVKKGQPTSIAASKHKYPEYREHQGNMSVGASSATTQNHQKSSQKKTYHHRPGLNASQGLNSLLQQYSHSHLAHTASKSPGQYTDVDIESRFATSPHFGRLNQDSSHGSLHQQIDSMDSENDQVTTKPKVGSDRDTTAAAGDIIQELRYVPKIDFEDLDLFRKSSRVSHEVEIPNIKTKSSTQNAAQPGKNSRDRLQPPNGHMSKCTFSPAVLGNMTYQTGRQVTDASLGSSMMLSQEFLTGPSSPLLEVKEITPTKMRVAVPRLNVEQTHHLDIEAPFETSETVKMINKNIENMLEGGSSFKVGPYR